MTDRLVSLLTALYTHPSLRVVSPPTVLPAPNNAPAPSIPLPPIQPPMFSLQHAYSDQPSVYRTPGSSLLLRLPDLAVFGIFCFISAATFKFFVSFFSGILRS
ncbi:hypothetical protein BDR04DRAFT_1159615 [Suillus decipiens]|nr:hypothetical protein BDR04DRAFT_1159615 [Suillus decipiens]